MSDIREQLARYYPPLGVRVVTPRLVLQMPMDEDLIRGELVRVKNVVLERGTWESRRRDDISIEGLDTCKELFAAG
jgi:hypothetical protein